MNSIKKIKVFICLALACLMLSSCLGSDLDNMTDQRNTTAGLNSSRAAGGSNGLSGQMARLTTKLQDIYAVTDYKMLYGITDIFSVFFQINLRDLTKGTQGKTSDAVKYGKTAQKEQSDLGNMKKDAVSSKISEGKVSVNKIMELSEKSKPTDSADDFKNIMKDAAGFQTPDGKYIDDKGNLTDKTKDIPKKPEDKEPSADEKLLAKYEEELYALRNKAYQEYQARRTEWENALYTPNKWDDAKVKSKLGLFNSYCVDMDKKVYDIMVLGDKIRKADNSGEDYDDAQTALNKLASDYPGFVESSKAENFGQLNDATSNELKKIKDRIAEIESDIDMITNDPEGFDLKYEIESAVNVTLSDSVQGDWDAAYKEARKTIVENLKTELEIEKAELNKKKETLQRYIDDSKDADLLKAVPIDYIYPEYFESDSYLMFDDKDSTMLNYLNEFVYGPNDPEDRKIYHQDRKDFDESKLYYEDNNIINFLRFKFAKTSSNKPAIWFLGLNNNYHYQDDYIKALDLSYKAYQKALQFTSKPLTDEERVEKYLDEFTDMDGPGKSYDNMEDDDEQDDNSNYLATGMYSPRVIYGSYSATFTNDSDYVKGQTDKADKILGWISPSSYTNGQNYKKSGSYSTLYKKDRNTLKELLAVYENPVYSDVAGYFYSESAKDHYNNYGYLGFDPGRLTSFHDFVPELVNMDKNTFNSFVEYLFNVGLDDYIYAEEVYATSSIQPVYASNKSEDITKGDQECLEKRNNYMAACYDRVNKIKNKYPTAELRSRFVRTLPTYNVIMFNYFMYIKGKWTYSAAGTSYNSINTKHYEKTRKRAYDPERVFSIKNFNSFDFKGNGFSFSNYDLKLNNLKYY